MGSALQRHCNMTWVDAVRVRPVHSGGWVEAASFHRRPTRDEAVTSWTASLASTVPRVSQHLNCTRVWGTCLCQTQRTAWSNWTVTINDPPDDKRKRSMFLCNPWLFFFWVWFIFLHCFILNACRGGAAGLRTSLWMYQTQKKGTVRESEVTQMPPICCVHRWWAPDLKPQDAFGDAAVAWTLSAIHSTHLHPRQQTPPDPQQATAPSWLETGVAQRLSCRRRIAF